MVLAVGGCAGRGRDFAMLASAELYNPATGTWVETASPNEARQGHRAILLLDGTVMVLGGMCSEDPTSGAPGSPLAPAELYDPGSGS